MMHEIKLLVLGLALAIPTHSALAGPAATCGGVRGPDNARVSYDDQGRLSCVIDDRHHIKTDFTYDENQIHVSEVSRVGYQTYSAEGEPKELWGPTRWSVYSAATGQLTTVHTYDDYNYTNLGLQTSWDLTNAAGSQLTANDDGSYDYVGTATQEDVEYNVANEKSRRIRLTEPLNIKKADCITIGGQQFALRRDPDEALMAQPYMSFATRTITGDVSASRAEIARFDNGARFATKTIGASPSQEDVQAAMYSSDYSYQERAY